jgi:hypothetical protein
MSKQETEKNIKKYKTESFLQAKIVCASIRTLIKLYFCTIRIGRFRYSKKIFKNLLSDNVDD